MTRWPVVLAPADDELLSSYLVRTAHQTGMSVHRFSVRVLQEPMLWMRDVDRSASDALLTRISEGTGLSRTRVEAMTLRAWEQSLRNPMSVGARMQAGVAPWILVVGIYHRIRRSYGLQLCRQCLEEAAYYRRSWRLAFQVSCPRHECLLIDRCSDCGMPVMPHRQFPGRAACHACGHLLSQATLHTGPGGNHSLSAAQEVHRLFRAGIEQGTVRIGDQCLRMVDAAHGIRVLLSIWQERVGHTLLIESSIRNKPDLTWDSGRRVDASKGETSIRRDSGVPASSLVLHHQFEMSGIDGRQRALVLLSRLLNDWPVSFVALAGAVGITQCGVPAHTTLPEWVREGLALLPLGHPWSRLRKSEAPSARQEGRRSLRWRLRHAKRINCPTWRVDRARLLMRAAGIRS